jgi:hypothetical protein
MARRGEIMMRGSGRHRLSRILGPASSVGLDSERNDAVLGRNLITKLKCHSSDSLKCAGEESAAFFQAARSLNEAA